MEQKKYWQSFGELSNSESHQKNGQDEFKSELPFEDIDEKGLLDATTPRRDFLKYLGFSTAAAVAVASCESPVRKSIPYVNKPQDLMPGEANYYATTYVSGGDAIPVVAKVRDGRPIKLEGNNWSTFTGGGTSAKVQASVLDLYDTARLRFPLADNKEVTSLEVFDKMVADAIAGAGQSPLILLTGTINSPTTKKIIKEFLAKFPAGSRHIQYDAISYSGLLLANEISYGTKSIPSYKFDQARVIVSLGADFLGTWLSPVEYQRDFSVGREIKESDISMSKFYQFESMMSMTGANADERFTHKPSETGSIALALLNAINGQQVAGFSNEKLSKGIAKVAKDLLANKGKGLVVCGVNNPNIQVIVNTINEAIGANGTTINRSESLLTRQGIDSEMGTLVTDMNAGRVGTLLVYDANPAYDYYNAEAFKTGLKKVKVSISCNERKCETTELCKFVIPSHHFLESWGDAEPKSAYISLLQPTIAPLFKTRQFQDSLLKWSGNTSGYDAYFKQYWMEKLGGADAYDKALQNGFIEHIEISESAAAGISGAFNNAGTTAAVAAVSAIKKGSGTELILYQNVAMGDGKQSNNPWLLELPDPITKATWDNYVMLSPVLAKTLFDIDIKERRQADSYEVRPEKPEVKITVGGKELTLPALIVPGMNNDTIAIAVGYGRKSASGKEEDTRNNIGRAAVGVGQNVFGLVNFNGSTTDFIAGDVTIKSTGSSYRMAITQSHSSYEGRHEVMKEKTLEDFKKHPKEILEERAKELEPWGGLENYDKTGTLYPEEMLVRPGIKWGMSIDLNSCFGCGACVVACNAENNIPVVGKHEVMRGHEMHWLRIDRYFSGNPDDPESIQTVFQPMLCQHCENAPCENVCPVAATNHSTEGLNQMIYNRCIGTRYCANNCPYKVRRFNWSDYTGADSFPNNQDQSIIGKLDDVVFMMGDDLTRMVLNPDVTVRSRGVIEKCSFCVQRLQEGKLRAKKADRILADDDIKTACQQACPAHSIEFGNVNNKESAISQLRKNNPNRTFFVLEPLHTLPSVNYLVKVRNTDVIAMEEGQHNRYKEEKTPTEKAHS
ncbi:MAG: TAT-variant-translocated molybdopterin oxidoreductase [Chitinophagaceae bacterium]